MPGRREIKDMMSAKKVVWMVLAVLLLLAACQPQIVEVPIEVTVISPPEILEVTTTPQEIEVEVTNEVIVTRLATEEVIVTATPPPVPQGGHVVTSSFSDISTLNPVLTTDNASNTVVVMMFNALGQLDPFTGSVLPDMAEGWTTSEDGLTITINLRSDITWSDGEPFTANDVAFTFDAINTEEVGSPSAANYASIDSWDVLDDHTLQLNLNTVDCAIPSNVFVQGIIPAHVYGGDPLNVVDSPENNAPTVVSGAFTFVEHLINDRVTLAANPTYYLGKPNVETWTYRVFADQSAEMASLLAGEIDYTSVGPQFASVVEAAIASQDPLNIERYYANGNTFIGYNLADPANPQNGWDDLDGDGKYSEGEPPLVQDPHPVLSDNEVRRAIAYSIDYTGLINKVVFGQGVPVVANVWPSIGWAYNNELEPYAQDLELAAQILDEAGWLPGASLNDSGVAIREKDGVPLSLSIMTNAGNETRENILILMKDVLDDLGFDMTVEVIEFGSMVQQLMGQTYDMVLVSFGGGPPDPDDSSLFSYTNDAVGAGFNAFSYYNETVEANLAAGKAVPGCNEADRAPFYLSNQEEIQSDLPVSFLYVSLNNTVWHDRMVGVTPNTWDIRYNAEQWYLEQ